jgi:hypothetical protein
MDRGGPMHPLGLTQATDPGFQMPDGELKYVLIRVGGRVGHRSTSQVTRGREVALCHPSFCRWLSDPYGEQSCPWILPNRLRGVQFHGLLPN